MNTTQIIAQMKKTDKIKADFFSNCNYVIEHSNTTNDLDFSRLQGEIKSLLDSFKEEEY